MRLTDHFTTDEFRCPCCGRVDEAAALRLAQALERARADSGTMQIYSGFRCPAHNAAVGGNPDSSHLLGLAADIGSSGGNERFRLVASLIRAGFTRIGIAAHYVHADIANHLPHPVIWTYY